MVYVCNEMKYQLLNFEEIRFKTAMSRYLFIISLKGEIMICFTLINIWGPRWFTWGLYSSALAAARTKNYSGAELEGVVKSAVSFALNRQLSLDDLTKPVEEENIKVTMDDFLNALNEVVPAFGASTDDLERCR